MTETEKVRHVALLVAQSHLAGSSCSTEELLHTAAQIEAYLTGTDPAK